jgi:hypothetical protein
MAASDLAAGAAAPSDDLKHVLDTARDALDHEFSRAERLDAKARGQATLAASWFTVALAASALILRSSSAPAWLIALLALCLALGGLSLFLLLQASSRVWRLRTRDDVTPETLRAMELAAGESDPEFAQKMIATYRHILEGAQSANTARADALEPSRGRWTPTLFWWGVLLFGLLEVVIALLSRVV